MGDKLQDKPRMKDELEADPRTMFKEEHWAMTLQALSDRAVDGVPGGAPDDDPSCAFVP